MKVNTNYKASVFSDLFSNPDTLRELYCALEGVTLPADIPVIINTLDDVLFMDRINDISFEIGGKLVIILEHQSSINPNITLRLLMYIARVYEKIVKDKDIYSEKLITIPKPEFFVLYNGTKPFEDEAVLKLSDSFENLKALGLLNKEYPALELVVKILNINEGRNNEVVSKCKTLSQYSTFVAKVREYEASGLKRAEAVKKALFYCRNHDILKEYLEDKGSEVFNMLMTEWNWDDAKEVWQREAAEKASEIADRDRQIRTAQKMKNAGEPLSKIIEFTELSPEEIERI